MFGSVALYGDIPCPKPKRLETISAEMDFQIREYMALNLFFGLICQVRRPVTVSRESRSTPGLPSAKNEPAD